MSPALPATWPATIVLPFTHQPDVAATMDIQIPALAWQPDSGSWRRTYRVGGTPTRVNVTEDDHALRFHLDPAPSPVSRDRWERLLRWHFPRQIDSLGLAVHPALKAMHDRYHGVVILRADPFEALVLTVLSQNRTGEIVRTVYPALDAHCGGITPARLAALDDTELAELIRSAGPYKAPRLAATARRIATAPDAFTTLITRAPGDEALAYLTGLPGVAHKTAACVLVFAAQSDHTLPVDTHLFRVAHRLGLAPHNGKLTTATREAITATLLGYSRDLAPAHFLFLLIGRSTCTAARPRCTQCFLQPHCPTAATTTARE